MTALSDTQLRIFVYDFIFARGRPPRVFELAAQFGVSKEQIRSRLSGLKLGKTLLLGADGEVRMAGPFASSSSGHDVIGSERRWWGNCAWDALAIGILAGENVTIRSTNCAVGDQITFPSSAKKPPKSDAVVHFLVPARDWYADIGFT